MGLYEKKSATVAPDSVSTIPAWVDGPNPLQQGNTGQVKVGLTGLEKEKDYMPGVGLINQGEIKQPETIDQVIDAQKRTYAQKAEDVYSGSMLQDAETYENTFGKEAPWSNRQEYEDYMKRLQKEDIDFLRQQQDLSRSVEQMQFDKAKAEAQASIAGVTAGMSQGREGPMGTSAPIFSEEYRQGVNQVNQMMELSKAAKESERQKTLKDLQNAQEQGNLEYASALRGKLDTIENDLRNQDQQARDFALREAQTQQQMELDRATFEFNKSIQTDANYRANLNVFSNMVDQGFEMNNQQISQFSKQLGVPFEVADAYYQGAKQIREDKSMDAQTRELSYDALKHNFNLVQQGFVTEQSQQIKGVMDMLKSGKITQQEASNFFMGMGIDNELNPITQMNNRINAANAVLREYQNKYLGKMPPEGSIERLEYDKADLELRIAEAEASEYTQALPQETTKDIFNLPGHGKWNTGEGEWQCAEGSNRITDGPKLGSAYSDKFKYVTKKTNPQIGNQLVIPYGPKDIGHVGTVISFNPIVNTIQTVEWNHNGDGKQTVETYNIDELNNKYRDQWGFTDSKLKSEYSKKLDGINNQIQINQELPQDVSWAPTLIENAYGDAEGGKAAQRKINNLKDSIKNNQPLQTRAIILDSLTSKGAATERTDFVNAININDTYRKTVEALDKFEELGKTHNLGDVIANNAQRALLVERAPEAVELQQRLTNLFNQYRKEVTGAGASVKELDMLQEGFPTWDKNLKDTKVMLNILQTDAKDQMNNKVFMMSNGIWKDYDSFDKQMKEMVGEPVIISEGGYTYDASTKTNNENYITNDDL